jgi:alanyl-tRNA synthetase
MPSASLIPDNDPTVLFTTAGMHPLVPYLMGEKHPLGTRLADCQKCIRTGDIDDVGDNRHLTFFEMLGNWSLGDYFKREAIEWSWEFLTGKEYLNLNPNRLYVTVFMGDENSPMDEESIAVWKEQFARAGIKAEVCPYNTPIAGNKNFRIFPMPAKDNWWGPAGETGPCGPCTEMFYDVDSKKLLLEKTFDEEVDSFRIIEIWNDVFMEFNKNAAGAYEKMAKKNVDTGMGLERTIMVLSGKKTVFETETFIPTIKKIEELSKRKYEGDSVIRAMRVIADHIKAATFIIGDDKGVTSSNTDQGYVVRRLIRRAIRYGREIGIAKELWNKNVAEVIINQYADIYPELKRNSQKIKDEFDKEEDKFSKTLERGLKEFENLVRRSTNGGVLSAETAPEQSGQVSAEEAFNLYQTYGFPLEITVELAREKGIEVDSAGFKVELEKHQELSRTAAAGKFKGGLADAGEETRKLHTAAHLLLAALRKVLGDQVYQKGSNITAERLRFDFSHPEKITDDQKNQVEDLVNQAIENKLPVVCQEMSLDQAKAIGAMGVFESKYGELVKVYTIGDSNSYFSREICGGPHADNTGELGHFKIQKEESSSSGVRRIKAVLG